MLFYSANRYNYATPPSSVPDLVTNTNNSSKQYQYFALTSNVLDGTYYPASGDVGIWDNAISDEQGYLSSPFVLTVTSDEELVVHAFRLLSDRSCIARDFTVDFYNGDELLHSASVRDNYHQLCFVYFDNTLIVTRYVLSVTRVSQPGQTLRLGRIYTPFLLRRNDVASVHLTETTVADDRLSLHAYDKLMAHVSEKSRPIIFNRPADEASIKLTESSVVTNVHSRMKDPSRQIFGKVYVTYTDPLLVADNNVSSSGAAYNSSEAQVVDGNMAVASNKLFTLYENNLTGEYIVGDEYSQVGWVSNVLSGANGEFSEPYPYIRLEFSERPITDLQITFDDSRGALVTDFIVRYTHADGSMLSKQFTGNTSNTVIVAGQEPSVVSIAVFIKKIARAGYPAVILEIPIASTVEYVGYKDRSDLISIDLLEELTYEDDVEALGGISANEVTVMFDNSNKEFFFNNSKSLIAKSLKRNRKVVPWLGVEVVPGSIEWYVLGTFWSYSWDVPVEGLTAKVVAFDTIGLLDKTDFVDHHLQIDKSIGELIEYVLEDAKRQLGFMDYKIDPALYDIIIPYAWFDPASHTAALRKISQCYPMHIYCDRSGAICAAPQKLRLDYYYDTWSDDTNVISKTYSSLFTTLPNVISVEVKKPTILHDEELANYDLPFDVSSISTQTLNFNKPYLSGIAVAVDCDSTVKYTYEVYSWGTVFNFTGSGEVRSIVCTGSAVDVSRTVTVSKRDADSVRTNGAVVRNIASDFIQTSQLATVLIDRILSLSEYDKYDATVEYRGDIALTINDPILLLNGIAPDNRYNIKRHELFWNGSLSGSAHLNT